MEINTSSTNFNFIKQTIKANLYLYFCTFQLPEPSFGNTIIIQLEYFSTTNFIKNETIMTCKIKCCHAPLLIFPAIQLHVIFWKRKIAVASCSTKFISEYLPGFPVPVKTSRKLTTAFLLLRYRVKDVCNKNESIFTEKDRII